MNYSTSPKPSLAKLGFYPKNKPFKVVVLGQSGVGKSALVVRFITKRYIGEYDPNLEKIYTFQTVIDNETVYFEILDTATGLHENEYSNLESHIRWAEAFILMYSVTDKCSFDECHRLKFLINYNKKKRRLGGSMKEGTMEVPVVLVGNKTDQAGDRMVSTEEGQRRSRDIGCVCFHEISVRESIDQAWSVFRDARRFWRVSSKSPRPRATETDVHPVSLARSLPRTSSESGPEPNSLFFTCLAEEEVEEDGAITSRSNSTSSSGRDREESGRVPSEDGVFRARASTDSRLPARKTRARHPPATEETFQTSRRMSVSMKGNNSSTY